ncbi:SCO6745 family protein [Streptomyces macrosporus]|uniref:SalK n=1 Tax=Streptomyces macrosporus TaxID=44032 RepID=A0ABN3JI73_9ACTN
MGDAERTARRLWTLIEPVHAVTYFAPRARAAFEEAGLRGFWRGYFAGRAAPLGEVGPGPVTAAFFGFAPTMVARALPGVWAMATPERALEARRTGARAALEPLLSGYDRLVEEAAALLVPVVEELDCAGRVLAAANRALPVPEGAVDRLWHAATVLREHRGDGHVAALVAAGLDGCEALVLRAGIDLPRAELQPHRGWSDDQWQAARDRLTARGWLGLDGTATPEGRQAHRAVEEATDRAAARPWQALAPATADRLCRLLVPPARACATALRFPNPMGLPAPAE